MQFGVVSGVGRGMCVLDRDSDRRRGRSSFVGEFGVSHCNQRTLLRSCESDALFPNYFGEDLFIYISS